MKYESNEHPIDEPLLTAYALDELEGEERAEIERMIAGDDSLRAEVESIRQTARQVRAGLEREPESGLSLAQWRRIEEALRPADVDEESPVIWTNRRLWIGGGITALAAMLVLALFLPVLIEQGAGPDLSVEQYAIDDEIRNRTVLDGELRDRAAAPSINRRLVIEEQEFDPATGRSLDWGNMTAPVGEAETPLPAPPPAEFERLEQQLDSARSGVERRREKFSGGGGSMPPIPGGAGGPEMTAPADRLVVDGPAGGDRAVPQREVARANEEFAEIVENDFVSPDGEDDSTFSIDVDTASYAIVRNDLKTGRLPAPNAVRIEELINYFEYDDEAPLSGSEHPFKANVEVASCPWNAGHRLVRIGLKGREIDLANRVGTNLVFLVDVSGSMDDSRKLPLLKEAMKMLVRALTADDRVAVVTYAGEAGLALPSTYCNDKETILKAIDGLRAGGSTNGGEGIGLAYQVAQLHFIEGGVNRVIWATDGDLNVGVTSDEALVRLIEEKRESGVFLTALGFGRGNLKDSKLEKVTNAGNGNYAFVDSLDEAKKLFVDQMGATLFTIASDVKIQVDFDPEEVKAFRLIGYENRLLAAEDFRDDTKDAGEIGAGHSVTALYEIVPTVAKRLASSRKAAEGAFRKRDSPPPAREDADAVAEEVRTEEGGAEPEPAEPVEDWTVRVRLRYNSPQGEKGIEFAKAARDDGRHWSDASDDFRFAAAVASFGMNLRQSPHRGDSDFDLVRELVRSDERIDEDAQRSEFRELVDLAEELVRQERLRQN